MGKVSATILGAIVGGFAAVIAMVWLFGWGTQLGVAPASFDPTRADYVDLLLTLVTILLAAIGLAVTVGAVVIGLVALKTLREIKDEASSEAKAAAAKTIAETMDNTLTEMAQRGELDEVLERVANRMQAGGPEDNDDEQANTEDES